MWFGFCFCLSYFSNFLPCLVYVLTSVSCASSCHVWSSPALYLPACSPTCLEGCQRGWGSSAPHSIALPGCRIRDISPWACQPHATLPAAPAPSFNLEINPQFTFPVSVSCIRVPRSPSPDRLEVAGKVSFAMVYGMSSSFTLKINYVHSLVPFAFFSVFPFFFAPNFMVTIHLVAGRLGSWLETLETSMERMNGKFTSGTEPFKKWAVPVELLCPIQSWIPLCMSK